MQLPHGVTGRRARYGCWPRCGLRSRLIRAAGPRGLFVGHNLPSDVAGQCRRLEPVRMCRGEVHACAQLQQPSHLHAFARSRSPCLSVSCLLPSPPLQFSPLQSGRFPSLLVPPLSSPPVPSRPLSSSPPCLPPCRGIDIDHMQGPEAQSAASAGHRGAHRAPAGRMHAKCMLARFARTLLRPPGHRRTTPVAPLAPRAPLYPQKSR